MLPYEARASQRWLVIVSPSNRLGTTRKFAHPILTDIDKVRWNANRAL